MVLRKTWWLFSSGNRAKIQPLESDRKSPVRIYTQKKKLSQYLCFLIKSTILHISLSNILHELYYRNFTFTCSLRDKKCLY